MITDVSYLTQKHVHLPFHVTIHYEIIPGKYLFKNQEQQQKKKNENDNSDRSLKAFSSIISEKHL